MVDSRVEGLIRLTVGSRRSDEGCECDKGLEHLGGLGTRRCCFRLPGPSFLYHAKIALPSRTYTHQYPGCRGSSNHRPSWCAVEPTENVSSRASSVGRYRGKLTRATTASRDQLSPRSSKGYHPVLHPVQLQTFVLDMALPRTRWNGLRDWQVTSRSDLEGTGGMDVQAVRRRCKSDI